MEEVLLFEGCMISRSLFQTRWGIHFLLDKFGIPFKLLPKEVCCGAPSAFAGNVSIVTKMIDLNLKFYFTKEKKEFYNTLIVGCPGCGKTLMENEKIHELNPEIFHIIEIIDTHLEKFKDSLRKIPCKVTAHFPCHLNRGMSVDCETIFENVLNIIPGVEYIPMVDPDTCCGGSGGVNTAFPDIAKKIREQKLKNIIDTGPQICVTACPLCETFLGEGLRSMGSKIVVLSLPFFVGLAFKDFKERLEEFLPRKKKGG